MVPVILETASFKRSLSFESWDKIHGRGGVSLVLLKVDVEDLDWIVNHKQKGFVWMRHICFVGRVSIGELLLEVFHMKDQNFGFIGDR